MPPGPDATQINLTDHQREELVQITRTQTSQQRAVRRAKIVLKAVDGASNFAIARD